MAESTTKRALIEPDFLYTEGKHCLFFVPWNRTARVVGGSLHLPRTSQVQPTVVLRAVDARVGWLAQGLTHSGLAEMLADTLLSINSRCRSLSFFCFSRHLVGYPMRRLLARLLLRERRRG